GLGGGSCLFAASFNYLPSKLGIFLIFFATCLHWRNGLDQVVRRPAFAFDTSNGRSTATSIDLLHGSAVAEDLVQVTNGANIWIPRIGTPHPRRVRDHCLQLLPDDGLRIAHQDEVVVGLRHLAAIGAG